MPEEKETPLSRGRDFRPYLLSCFRGGVLRLSPSLRTERDEALVDALPAPILGHSPHTRPVQARVQREPQARILGEHEVLPLDELKQGLDQRQARARDLESPGGPP